MPNGDSPTPKYPHAEPGRLIARALLPYAIPPHLFGSQTMLKPQLLLIALTLTFLPAFQSSAALPAPAMGESIVFIGNGIVEKGLAER